MDKQPRILVVDDEKSIRETFKVILEDEGYVVDFAENGEEAIKLSNATIYDLALIDIRLPDIEGVQLLDKLKDTIPKMRKIIVTGFPSMQNAVEALNNGADGFLLKPVKIPVLINKINEELKKREENEKYSENKVAEFVEGRVRKILNT